MQMSNRARRMERRNDRGKRGVALNLVSLMDIFTILVFFLLVSSTDVEVLPSARDITLPESIAEQKARENVVVMIAGDQILVQGEPVADLAPDIGERGLIIPRLERALREQTARVLRRDPAGAESREVTIMGDRELPYSLLKRVMATCTAAEYGRISLAVNQRSPASTKVAAATRSTQ